MLLKHSLVILVISNLCSSSTLLIFFENPGDIKSVPDRVRRQQVHDWGVNMLAIVFVFASWCTCEKAAVTLQPKGGAGEKGVDTVLELQDLRSITDFRLRAIDYRNDQNHLSAVYIPGESYLLHIYGRRFKLYLAPQNHYIGSTGTVSVQGLPKGRSVTLHSCIS